MIVAVCFLLSVLVACLPQSLREFLILSPQHHSMQYLTYAFVHAGLGHLVYNFALTVIPGVVVERELGQRDTAITVCAIAVMSAVAHSSLMGVDGGLCGFSGVCFGLLAMSALIEAKRHNVLVGATLATAVGAIMLLEGAAIGNPFDMTAHAGHLGGAIAGLMLYGMRR